MLFDGKKIKSLNETEKSVYHFILNNMDEQIQNMSVREIAAEAGTSTAAVLRFCQKMGCDGLDDFKGQLKAYTREKAA